MAGRLLLLVALGAFCLVHLLPHALRAQPPILLVPGFFPKPELMERFGLRNLHQDVITLLRDMGFETKLSRIWYGGSIEEGWPIVAEEIQEFDQPVILIGHSLGGKKVLHALVESPRAAANVAGVILMQSPLQGSLVAHIGTAIAQPHRPVFAAHRIAVDVAEALTEFSVRITPYPTFGKGARKNWFERERESGRLLDARLRKQATDLFHALHGGDPRVIEELRITHAKAYIRRNQTRIEELIRTIPIVCVTSCGNCPFSPVQLPLRMLGFENDAVVGLREMTLGLGEQVLALGRRVDHFKLVLRPFDHETEWRLCLRALLAAAIHP